MILCSCLLSVIKKEIGGQILYCCGVLSLRTNLIKDKDVAYLVIRYLYRYLKIRLGRS